MHVITDNMIAATQLTRLLQLASPMLPVGAYSYSQVLEAAIECGQVHNLDTTAAWLKQVVTQLQLGFELPLLHRLLQAWQTQDEAAVQYWNQRFCCSRETSELQAETVQMGHSLAKLLRSLEPASLPPLLSQMKPLSFPCAYACAAVCWQIPHTAALQAYLWSWLENQASVAMKLIPLGQTDGQRLLWQLSEYLPAWVAQSQHCRDDELNTFAPAYALLSCAHEQQYSRLFRS